MCMISQLLIGAGGIVLATLVVKLPGIAYDYLEKKRQQRAYEKSLENRRMGYSFDPYDRDDEWWK